MNLPDEVAKAKKIEAVAAADVSALEADAKAEVSGIAKAWADSKAALIGVAAVFLFVGFALGRASCHI